MTRKKRSRAARRATVSGMPGVIRQPGLGDSPKPVTISRTAFAKQAYELELTDESALYGDEGVSGRVSLQYSLAHFYSPVNFDQFRFEWIELTARLRTQDVTEQSKNFSNIYQSIDIFTSFDQDDHAFDNTQTGGKPLEWKNWTDRSNIGKIVITPAEPMKLIGRFKPAALNPASNNAYPSVSRIWTSDGYYDCEKATGQRPLKFGSFQIFAHANNYNKDGEKPFIVDIVAEAKFTLRGGI